MQLFYVVLADITIQHNTLELYVCKTNLFGSGTYKKRCLQIFAQEYKTNEQKKNKYVKKYKKDDFTHITAFKKSS